ncbi:hypothetical protein Bhyg_06612 [Pseudolycoriella hygida]|uniref:Uncharacterized protein n=1 Tax=Pseudolycoriella hygida TaxID=35572 RepID=A0A9Q0N277_9DIPT|nr:hypothetical protein Bhyg_06612 [Pseudolycoriella hygida]
MVLVGGNQCCIHKLTQTFFYNTLLSLTNALGVTYNET